MKFALPKMTRPLRVLIGAQLPADFADWLDFVAIGALLAFVWSAPPQAFALLAVSMGLPYLLVGPVAASIVDRSDLRTVMILANLGRAVATFALLIAQDWPSLLLIVALRASIDSIYGPAKQAAIQALADEGQLAPINSLSFTIMQLSKVIAPLIGGALLAIAEPALVFILNGVLSLIAAAILIWFPSGVREPAEKGEGGLFRPAREALGIVAKNSALRLVFITMFCAIFGNFLFDTQIALHLKSIDFGPRELGFFLSAVGAGAIFGAVLPLEETNRAVFRATSGAALLAGASLGLIGMMGAWPELAALPVFIGLAFIVGIASSRAFLPMRVLLQREAPPEQMARVAALLEANNTIALLTAPFLGAAITRIWGTQWAFIAGAAVFVLLAPMVWFFGRQLAAAKSPQ